MFSRVAFSLLVFGVCAGPASATLADLERSYNICGDAKKDPKYRLQQCTELITYIKSGHLVVDRSSSDTGQFRLRDLYVSRAQVYYQMGQPQEALEDLDEAVTYLKLNDVRADDNRLRGWPRYQIYYLQAQAQIDLKRYQDAIDSLREADHLMEYGKFASDQERLEMASNISRTTGVAYTYLGQPQVGFAVVNLAIEQNPKSAEAYVVRAAIYKSLGQMPESEADLATAKSLAP